MEYENPCNLNSGLIMTDYVKILAEYLLKGTPVVLYTVGSDTFSVIRSLKYRFGILPTAVCDGDVKKHGRKYLGLSGVPVLSPDEAIDNYPDAQFFISSIDHRFQIIGELISRANYYGIKPIPQQVALIMKKITQGLESLNILCAPYIAYETFEYVASLKTA